MEFAHGCALMSFISSGENENVSLGESHLFRYHDEILLHGIGLSILEYAGSVAVELYGCQYDRKAYQGGERIAAYLRHAHVATEEASHKASVVGQAHSLIRV